MGVFHPMYNCMFFFRPLCIGVLPAFGMQGWPLWLPMEEQRKKSSKDVVSETLFFMDAKLRKKWLSRWWFQIFFIFTPNLGEMLQFWLIFFKRVETTNQLFCFGKCIDTPKNIGTWKHHHKPWAPRPQGFLIFFHVFFLQISKHPASHTMHGTNGIYIYIYLHFVDFFWFIYVAEYTIVPWMLWVFGNPGPKCQTKKHSGLGSMYNIYIWLPVTLWWPLFWLKKALFWGIHLQK